MQYHDDDNEIEFLQIEWAKPGIHKWIHGFMDSWIHGSNSK